MPIPFRVPLQETESDVFKRGAATEARFRTLVPQAVRMHLAMHGEMRSVDSFESPLLISPRAGDDGNLTVSEIMKMNLSADLVVLLIRDTGNGQVISGEGFLKLSGFSRSLRESYRYGAMGGLKKKVTADLMLNFYRKFKKSSKAPAKVLRAGLA